MTEIVVVNSDRSRIVSEDSPDAAYRIHRKEAVQLGLLKTEEVPKQVRRSEPAAGQKRRKP